MSLFSAWKTRARLLKRETYALYFACRDRRIPWYAKVFTAFVVGYAFSPLDLIPDFIPVIGYLDDLVLVPLGVALALRMIPAPVLAECRAKADGLEGKPVSVWAAGVIVLIWLVGAAWLGGLLLPFLRGGRGRG